jgi:hypothetical protein
MASRLRPTPETGTVAATKMPASSIGPSWSQRGSREARLAFRQAQKRGDREGAMRIAAQAEEQGYASQASIGSAEERLAGQYQGRQKDTAITAEIGTALTPPGPGRDMIDTPAGPRRAPVAGGMQEQAAGSIVDPQTGRLTSVSTPAPRPDYSKPPAPRPDYGEPSRTTMDMRRGDPGFQDRTVPSATRPPIPEAPAVPGASQPPENPVTGSSVPATGDAESRLGQRRGSFALQGLAGRQALSANLRKSIAAGGGDLSGDRLKRAKAEADRLGVTPEQFLGELQDIGASVPGEDLKTLMPADNRSLDQRLRAYQDEYLGGGPSSELTSRLRADSATNLSAAESMRRARERSATPAPAPAPAARTAPTPTPAPSRASPVGGSPAPATIAPSSGPLAPSRPPSALKNLIERGKENVRGTAFEGSKGYNASLAVGDFLTETLPDTAEDAKRRAAALAQQGRARAVAAVRSARDRALEKTKGTAFEGSRAYQLLTR